jgi:hypothetical protein
LNFSITSQLIKYLKVLVESICQLKAFSTNSNAANIPTRTTKT